MRRASVDDYIAFPDPTELPAAFKVGCVKVDSAKVG